MTAGAMTKQLIEFVSEHKNEPVRRQAALIKAARRWRRGDYVDWCAKAEDELKAAQVNGRDRAEKKEQWAPFLPGSA